MGEILSFDVHSCGTVKQQFKNNILGNLKQSLRYDIYSFVCLGLRFEYLIQFSLSFSISRQVASNSIEKIECKIIRMLLK